MRALVATTGSDGDIRPFLALAKELQRRGHEVLFAAPDYYGPVAADQGVAFRKFGPPLARAEMDDVFARILAQSNPLDQLVTVMDYVAGPEREAIPELLEMAASTDLVIYPPMLVAAAAAARAKSVRHVSVQLAPVHRARDYSPTGTNLGAFFNGVSWSLAAWMMRRATDDKLNEIVRAAGLPPWKDILLEAASSSLLDLVAVSPRVLPRDPGWPASTRVCGYWFLDEPHFTVDPELEAFVADERPVVIGFGSMLGFDPAATTRVLLEAVRGLPRKVVLQAGWAGLGQLELPKHVHVTKFVPHAWLFSRAACVVHHGGAGTTAAAFRAGIPQTIVWHLGDQPVWGKRTKLLGVAPGFVSHRKLTARWLRAQIERMCADEAMQQKARALGETIREENGVGTAADMIEAVAAG